MSRGLNGLGPPEFVEFADRRSDLNELLWPALFSVADVSREWRRDREKIEARLIKTGISQTLRFDPRRVFDGGGFERFERAFCRLASTSIASEFGLFIDAFWNRIKPTATKAGYTKGDLFKLPELDRILNHLTASPGHPIRAIIGPRLVNLLSPFTPTYVLHLVTLQSYFRELRNCVVHNDGVVNIRLAASSASPQALHIERAPYSRRHQFGPVYCVLGDTVQLSPHKCIAMVYFLNQFVEMLSCHLMAGNFGDAVFEDRMQRAIKEAEMWIKRRGITAARRLTDECLSLRIRSALYNEGIRLPSTVDRTPVLSSHVEQLRQRLK